MDLALLVLRAVLGGFFLVHGSGKLFGAFGRGGLGGFTDLFEQLGLRPGRPLALLAGLCEFVGGMLVLIGFLTPLGALLIAITMLVAIARVHGKNGFFNTDGGMEYNLALIGIAVALVLAGPGAYSLDGAMGILW